jgi:putative tryptophan/tyrosine transport system substrate-binding protein
MRRREFIAGLGAAATWAVAGRAQQPAFPTIGFLHQSSLAGYSPQLEAFHRALSENGYVEGRNLAVEYRFADDHLELLPALAADLVQRRVSVIATGGTPATLAAKAATTTIPIVFSMGGGVDPVNIGLVASLNRPGGNVTGSLQFNSIVITKRLELLREAVPKAEVIGVLIHPNNASGPTTLALVQDIAQRMGQKIRALNAVSPEQFEEIFATIERERVGALLIQNDPLFTGALDRLAALATRYAVPSIYEYREFAQAGGLMSYGVNPSEGYHQVGTYVGRILKGERPADLPVAHPTKFSFAVNLKTAKALSITMPPNLLALADEVIE